MTSKHKNQLFLFTYLAFLFIICTSNLKEYYSGNQYVGETEEDQGKEGLTTSKIYR